MAFLLLPPAQAQNATASQPGKRIALLIGNAAYKGDMNASTLDWTKLQNAAKDARDVGNELKRLGFRPEDVEVLQDLKLRDMRLALERFKERAKKAEQVVFYFSGHGAQHETLNYLIPVDAPDRKLESLNVDSVKFDEVVAAVSVGPGQKLVMIDACRTVPGSNGDAGGLANPESRRSLPANTIVLFAAAANQHAMDGRGYANGYFAQGLLEGLRQNDTSLRNVIDVAEAKVLSLSGGTQQVTPYGSSLAQKAFLFAPARPVQAAVDPRLAEREAAIARREAELEKRQLALAAAASTASATSTLSRQALLTPSSTPPAPGLVPAQNDTVAAKASFTPVTLTRPTELPPDCDVCPIMVALPGRSYLRGSLSDDNYGRYNEKPAKTVTISAFAIGKFEVTQRQWQTVMGSNPSHFQECGPDCPVELISWNDAQAYVAKLNALTNNRLGYRLPTESEWEMAARGGTKTPFYTGDAISSRQANFNGGVNVLGVFVAGAELKKTAPVGSYEANPYGLQDMLGNVAEWTQDCYEENYNNAPTDGRAYQPVDKAKDCYRVARGGSWNETPRNHQTRLRDGPWFDSFYGLRSASRGYAASDRRSAGVGLRIARSVF